MMLSSDKTASTWTAFCDRPACPSHPSHYGINRIASSMFLVDISKFTKGLRLSRLDAVFLSDLMEPRAAAAADDLRRLKLFLRRLFSFSPPIPFCGCLISLPASKTAVNQNSSLTPRSLATAKTSSVFSLRRASIRLRIFLIRACSQHR